MAANQMYQDAGKEFLNDLVRRLVDVDVEHHYYELQDEGMSEADLATYTRNMLEEKPQESLKHFKELSDDLDARGRSNRDLKIAIVDIDSWVLAHELAHASFNPDFEDGNDVSIDDVAETMGGFLYDPSNTIAHVLKACPEDMAQDGMDIARHVADIFCDVVDIDSKQWPEYVRDQVVSEKSTVSFRGHDLIGTFAEYAGKDHKLALQLYDADSGEPYVTATVNLGLSEPYLANIDEPVASGLTQALVDAGLVQDTGFRDSSGFNIDAYPVVVFNPEAMEAFDATGAKHYAQAVGPDAVEKAKTLYNRVVEYNDTEDEYDSVSDGMSADDVDVPYGF